jgi:hypothetical protein
MFKKLPKVPLGDLLLDPGNPRFADGFVFDQENHDLESMQENVIKHFENKETDAGEGEESDNEKYGVDNLITSIRTIGFVPIDKPVVRRIEGTGKFRVIEGNRRVCACKILLNEHLSETANGRTNPGDRRPSPLSEDVYQSITHLDVLELDLDGLSEEEQKRRERIVLGVRHHGSLLEWKPLPKAFSVYQEYMAIEPPLEEFTWIGDRERKVRDIFTLGKASPKKALRGYIAFKQLKDSGFSIEPGHFSLLQELVTNSKISGIGGRLTVDSSNFRLSEPSLTEVNEFCQFDTRDSSEGTPQDFNILKDPKSVKALARLIDATRSGDSAVSDLAKSLLEKVKLCEIPLEPMKEHPEQSAVEALTEFQNRKAWVDELRVLLDRISTDSDLEYSKFGGTNDYLRLDDLDAQMRVFRRVFELNK